ncbi:MAG: 4Fe-4S binding protein, partial [Casimicrobiaceae bacterium]
TGCGRCTAVCPTEALTLPAVSQFMVRWHEAPAREASDRAVPGRAAKPPHDAQPAHTDLKRSPCRIECSLVPESEHAPDTAVLPCLAALKASHLCALAAAGQRVEVIDRGWCQGCSAVNWGVDAPHPAAAAIEEARLLLESVGAEGLPELVSEPLALSGRPAHFPATEPTEAPPNPARRRFFTRGVLESPAGSKAVAPMGGDGRAAFPAAERRPSPDRTRLVASLTRLAEEHRSTVPPELFPALAVDDRCCDHRMCVALCPTTALTVFDNGADAHLLFHSERCISCGACVRSCPEGALHLSRTGGERQTVRLITHRQQVCPSCGVVFTPSAEARASGRQVVCPTCTKSSDFIADARRQLFGIQS